MQQATNTDATTFPVFIVQAARESELRTTNLEAAVEFAGNAAVSRNKPVTVESVDVPLWLPRTTIAVFPPE